MKKIDFLNKARSKHGYKYNYVNLPDILKSKDIIDMYFDDKFYHQKVYKHLLGKCPEKNMIKKTTNDFIKESKKIYGNRFDYTLTNYINSTTKVKLHDSITGKVYEQIPNLHLNKHTNKSLTKESFIQSSMIISNYNYNYDNTYFKNLTTKCIINCYEHGDFEVKPYDHLNYGKICPYCDESNFSKKVSYFLNKKNICFTKQFKFKENSDINILPFDFYIPSIRMCIDFIPENSLNINQLKINDKIKNDYCENNYINILKIKYFEIDKINNILYNSIIPLIKILHKQCTKTFQYIKGDKVLFKNKVGVIINLGADEDFYTLYQIKIDDSISYGYDNDVVSYKQYRDVKINNILNGV